MAAVSVLASDSDDEARRDFEHRRREFARGIFSRPGQRLDDAQLEALLASPQIGHVDQMLRFSAVGTADRVSAYLEDFRALIDADELITVHQARSLEGRLRSLELLAGVTAVS
jgi:alkanesulfonate monooxygenase SsuD/methylene tetrahydromethanopterin reductase-like flavin-dependent oxidoreductase (luciferase family)